MTLGFFAKNKERFEDRTFDETNEDECVHPFDCPPDFMIYSYNEEFFLKESRYLRSR